MNDITAARFAYTFLLFDEPRFPSDRLALRGSFVHLHEDFVPPQVNGLGWWRARSRAPVSPAAANLDRLLAEYILSIRMSDLRASDLCSAPI